MSNEQWHRVWFRGTLMNEMNREVIDLGHELVKRVHPGLTASPVIRVPPILGKFFDVRERNALGPIIHCFGFRPASGIETSM